MAASVTAINFPDSLLTIREQAFHTFTHGTPIKTIELPSTIQTIDGYAFTGRYLETVTMRDVGVRTQPLDFRSTLAAPTSSYSRLGSATFTSLARGRGSLAPPCATQAPP